MKGTSNRDCQLHSNQNQISHKKPATVNILQKPQKCATLHKVGRLTLAPGRPDSPVRPGSPVAPLAPEAPGTPRSPGTP